MNLAGAEAPPDAAYRVGDRIGRAVPPGECRVVDGQYVRQCQLPPVLIKPKFPSIIDRTYPHRQRTTLMR